MSLCYIIYKLYIEFAFAMVGEQSVPVDSIHTYGKFSRKKIFQFQSMQKTWILIKHVQISVSLHLKGPGRPTFSYPECQFSRPFLLRRTVNTNTFCENVDLYLSQHHVTRWHVNGAFFISMWRPNLECIHHAKKGIFLYLYYQCIRFIFHQSCHMSLRKVKLLN